MPGCERAAVGSLACRGVQGKLSDFTVRDTGLEQAGLTNASQTPRRSPCFGVPCAIQCQPPAAYTA